MLIAAQLAAALVLLALASDAFTNAVEWLGVIFGLGRSAAGAIVAAVGSSLPETMIAFVALVVLHDLPSREVGIGAVIGAPFMLATLVFCLLGVTALSRKPSHNKLTADLRSTIFGLCLFALTFAVVIGASFAPTATNRIAASAIVLVVYAIYLMYHLRARDVDLDEQPPALRFAPRAARPAFALVALQTIVAIVVTILASRWFVGSLTQAAIAGGVSPLLASLILSPIATEIPEAMNVTIWMRRGLDELAMSNVIGAMMFQTSIACALAMLVSPWQLDRTAYAAAVAAFAAVGLVLAAALTARRLSPWLLIACGLLYAGFLLFVTR